jgi:phage shock protein A
VGEKQSIFGRIAQLTKANINSMLDSAEDPEKMMDQMIRDYKNNITEAEEAIATTIGNVRLLEQDTNEDRAAVTEWGNKAAAASSKAEELRAAGNTADADKFDKLARVALEKQIQFEGEIKDAEPAIASQNQIVEKLKAGLDGMKGKLAELQQKRDSLVARGKLAEAQSKVHDAVKSVNIMDPTSEVSRFEEKIRREEAKVMGQTELAASSLDSQFEALEDMGSDAEVEARLAALKAGG